MIIEKILNNNVVISKNQQGHEIIIMGCIIYGVDEKKSFTPILGQKNRNI